MNRPYTRENIDRIFGALNQKKFTEVDTHIIIGFPGETDADFEETMQFSSGIGPSTFWPAAIWTAP